MAQGWGVYMMSYRGYGGGTGSPTETANVADARLAYGALLLEGVEPASIILYGESLGSCIAVRLATERPVGGVVLDAPYTSIVDVAAQAYPFLPVRLLLADRYETTKYIAQVQAPLLVLHGERDEVIPVAMGRELFRLANEPKRLATFAGGGHSDLYLNGNGALEACGIGSAGSTADFGVTCRSCGADAPLPPAEGRGTNGLRRRGATSARRSRHRSRRCAGDRRCRRVEDHRDGRRARSGARLHQRSCRAAGPRAGARLRASLRARRTASAFSRTRFSEGFS